MKSKLRIGLIILAALVFSASFGYVVRQMVKGREAESAFQSLSEQYSETESETTEKETEETETLSLEESTESLSEDMKEPLPVIKKPRKEWLWPEEESTSVVPEETSTDSLSVRETGPAISTRISEASQPSGESVATRTTASSPYYKGIRNCVGWLRIDGTAINYPVMQSKDDSEFYLHHALSGEYSYPGVPFLDACCEVGISNHLVIYGHNMKNGTMFHDLRYYSSFSYWQSHRQICLDTLGGSAVYEIMAVIQYDSEHDPFRFNAHTKMDSDIFAWFVSQVKARQIYETDITASFGDELLTLSTCDWTYTNGRLLVIARRCRN